MYDPSFIPFQSPRTAERCELNVTVSGCIISPPKSVMS